MYISPGYDPAVLDITVIVKSGITLAILTLPKTFSKAPTSCPSDLLTATFLAFLYSPDGSNLSSRSLFILDLRKVFLASAI